MGILTKKTTLVLSVINFSDLSMAGKAKQCLKVDSDISPLKPETGGGTLLKGCCNPKRSVKIDIRRKLGSKQEKKMRRELQITRSTTNVS